MTSLLGERAMESALVDTGLNKQEAEQLAFDLSPWTGELCYTTPTCTDGSSGERTGDQVCKGGFTAVSMAHSPLQRNGDYEMHGECAEDCGGISAARPRPCPRSASGLEPQTGMSLVANGAAVTRNLN